MEDGVQLSVHQPLMVRLSLKAHHPIHLQVTTPLVGPTTTIHSCVSRSSSSSPIVHAECETLVIIGSCDNLMLKGRGKVSVDAKWRTEGCIERRAFRNKDPIKKRLHGPIGLALNLVKDM